MSNKVLSVEIGQNITRVVEMDYKVKKPKVYSSYSFETPMLMVEDGVVANNQIFVAKFKQGYEEQMLDTTKVIFTIASSRIANREVTLPLVKEKQIPSMIAANASEYFPVDLTQYKLIHSIIEKVDTPEVKEYKLSVMAFPIDMIRSYMELAENCGLTVEGFDYVGNSVYQVAKRHFTEGSNILIKVEAFQTLITIVQGDKQEMQRSVPYGIGDAVEALMASKAYGTVDDYMAAAEIFTRKTCIRRHLDPEDGYKEEEDIREDITKTRIEITEALRPLISNLNRTLNYYMSNHTDEKIDKIQLAGLGADFSGLSKLLTNELGQKVTIFSLREDANLTREKGTDDFSPCRYIASIGATLDPLMTKKDLSEREGAKKKDKTGSLGLAIGVFSFCMIATIFMLVYGIVSGLVLKKDNQELMAKKDSLQAAQNVYTNFETIRNDYNELNNLYAYTSSPNEELDKFITELEQKMPSTISVISFNADSTGVNMDITIANKESAAETLLQLRSFESLADVSTTGVTEDVDETGSTTVSMSLTCSYPSAANSAESEDGTTDTTATDATTTEAQ